jgi:predicted amidophosphoribosyltransferase
LAICVCELCNKPYNGIQGLCRECIKLVDETYIKARKFIYQYPIKADFATMVQETDLSEKALSYLINKGRLEIASRNGGGRKCRACGRETQAGNICEQCRVKLLSEKLTAKPDSAKTKEPENTAGASKKSIIPLSYEKD